MTFSNPFSRFAFGNLFDSILPDFVLAFTFFTAICYAVLGKRFEHQRSAVAASAALGFALAMGLVWWEQGSGLSIRNLGHVAVGFAVVILGSVMYQAVRQTGGNWAGAGIALGVSLMIAWVLGMQWPVPEAIVQTVMLIALILGILAFFSHQKGQGWVSARPVAEKASVRHDMSDLYEDRRTSKALEDRFRQVRKQADQGLKRPEQVQEIARQIQRMLPAEGYLTERLARLREKMHAMREGHGARIEQLQAEMESLPPEARKRAESELVASYKELTLDKRLERLDAAVAFNERQIRDLTRQAQEYAAAHDHKHLSQVLERARALQKHNSHLFKIIDRTEGHLEAAARKVAKNAKEVNRA